VLLSIAGCERSTVPRPTASRPAAHPTGLNLRDWTRDPLELADPPGKPLRILSAAPNITEMCCALRLDDRLVGRTRYCTYPPRILDVPSIGDLYHFNVESLVEMRPDLILIAGASRGMTDRLDPQGLKYETLPDVALADLFTSIERIGARTGRSRTAAVLNERIRADLDTVARHFADVPPARVLISTAPLPDPPTTIVAAGPGSFYDDLLVRAGHTNIAAPAGRPFSPLSLEFIIDADPDVIIELVPDDARPGGDADALRAWARIGALRAVRTGRVHVLRGGQHFLLGPRIAQTFAALCATIAGQNDATPSTQPD